MKKAFAEAEICVSFELLKEYHDTPLELEAKGKIDHKQLKALISGIAAFVAKAVVVQPKESMIGCRDEDYNIV